VHLIIGTFGALHIHSYENRYLSRFTLNSMYLITVNINQSTASQEEKTLSLPITEEN